MLQAEGAYEAALAGAQSSEVGVAGAQTNLSSALESAITAYQSTHITVDSLLHNDIDDVFTIEDGIATGFKLDGKGQAPTLNAERTTLETLVTEWGVNKANATADTIPTLLQRAKENTAQITTFVESINVLLINQEVTNNFLQTRKDEYEAMLFSTRTSLNAVSQQLNASETNIINAQKALEQAEIAGANNAPSAASAQVKIALGSLRAAQANYEKTLVRTPISGVVNALYLKAGDYVSLGQQAAIVANNGGLEIVTAVSEDDRNKIMVGEEVSIDDNATGTIAAIAGSVDPTTGKVAIKISVNPTMNLTNGSIVQIAFAQEKKQQSTQIVIPLSAIKMTGNGPIAFVVSDENILEAKTLQLGSVQGDSVIVRDGITFDTELVLDARGLKVGQQVSIKTN